MKPGHALRGGCKVSNLPYWILFSTKGPLTLRGRLLGEALNETLSDSYCQIVASEELTPDELAEREQIERMIGERSPAENFNLNSITSGAVRIFCEKRCFQEESGTPRLEHSLDCGDLLYGTHCLHCGTELTDHIARCPACKRIRLGFECIEPFVEHEQALSAPDVFGIQVMTDVREPDQGTWIGAFRFLELYLQEQEEIEGNHEEE